MENKITYDEVYFREEYSAEYDALRNRYRSRLQDAMRGRTVDHNPVPNATTVVRLNKDEDGSVTMRETLDLGLTIDERLADGYYYSKSVRLLKYLLEHPDELEKPLKEEVQYE